MLLVHRRDIIEPVEIGDRLKIGLVLYELLSAAVQQAYMRVDAVHDLAVELHDHTQYPVRRGMLRSEIQRVVPDLRFGHQALSAFSSPGSGPSHGLR